MMRHFNTIYKYQLFANEDMKPQIIEFPGVAVILTVMEQDDRIVLYAKHDVYEYENMDWKEIKNPKKFLVLGTGWEYENERFSGQYIGTVKVKGYMWHVLQLWD